MTLPKCGQFETTVAPMHGGVLQMQDDLVASPDSRITTNRRQRFARDKFRHRESFAGSAGASRGDRSSGTHTCESEI